MDDYTIQGHAKLSFLVVNSNYKALRGNRYELTSIDGNNKTGLFTTEEEYGDYHFFKDLRGTNGQIVGNQNEKIADALPDIIKEEMENIRTVNDLNYFNQHSEVFEKTVNETYSYINYHFNIPFRFHQIRTANGMQKTDMIVVGECDLSYRYDSNNNIIKKDLGIYITDYQNNKILFTNNIPTVNNISDLMQFESQEFGHACLNTDNQGLIIQNPSGCTKFPELNGSAFYDLVPYFIAQEGDVSFNINNTVNGVAKYNASKERDLNYKITITNTGNAASGNNQITANVPKEIVIDENSISNNGHYNKTSNTIVWNIDHLEPEEVLELSFKATVPKDVKTTELISNSTINSDNTEMIIVSNNTIVTLDKTLEILENPYTGNVITYLGLTFNAIVVVVVMISLVTIFIQKRKANK